MRVDQLIAVLEHMPPGAEIHICGTGVSTHVSQVDRYIASKDFVEPLLEGQRKKVGGRVVLRGSVTWYYPEPDYEIIGKVRRRKELEARLDALEDMDADTDG